MESTGEKSRVHLSSETAKMLVSAGKTSWVKQRDEKVVAKGKGELTTYWLELFSRSETGSEGVSDGSTAGTEMPQKLEKDTDPVKQQRLIDWNVEMLGRALYEIAAHNDSKRPIATGQGSLLDETVLMPAPGKMVLDEVREIITLPRHSGSLPQSYGGQLDPDVVDQLRDYVTEIAGLYNNNPCKLCFY